MFLFCIPNLRPSLKNIMSKCVIKRNFARGARHYDKHSSVQKECAEKLLELVGEGSRSRILEIGCGTGVYTSGTSR